jgi:hypothetical protein
VTASKGVHFCIGKADFGKGGSWRIPTVTVPTGNGRNRTRAYEDGLVKRVLSIK